MSVELIAGSRPTRDVRDAGCQFVMTLTSSVVDDVEVDADAGAAGADADVT